VSRLINASVFSVADQRIIRLPIWSAVSLRSALETARVNSAGKTALPPTVGAPSRVSGWSSAVSPSGQALAEERIGFGVGDAVQPRGEPRRVIQFAEILVCLQKNILTQIQSVFAVGDDAQQ
jgi:hypothetical protein